MIQHDAKRIRFEIVRGLQQVPLSTIRNLGGAADKRQAALSTIADTILARFKGYEFHGPEPIPAHGDGARYEASKEGG